MGAKAGKDSFKDSFPGICHVLEISDNFVPENIGFFGEKLEKKRKLC